MSDYYDLGSYERAVSTTSVVSDSRMPFNSTCVDILIAIARADVQIEASCFCGPEHAGV